MGIPPNGGAAQAAKRPRDRILSNESRRGRKSAIRSCKLLSFSCAIWDLQSEAFRVARVFVKERVDLSGQFRISVDFLAITVCHKQLSVGASCIEFDITRLELLLNWALDTHSSIP